jgi:hypothetical protein
MIKKIGDINRNQFCSHPEHNFPNMIVLPDGIYEHICPGCGAKQVVTIINPRYESHSWTYTGPGVKTYY